MAGPLAARVLAVSMGDPAGIGLDILIGAIGTSGPKALPPFAVYGCAAALSERCRALAVALEVVPITEPEHALLLTERRIGVVDIPCAASVRAGAPDPANGAAVIGAIERAVADVAHGAAAALVTCPIAKATLYAAGFRHPGHTEFLAELAMQHWPGRSYRSVMMLVADELKVVPLTIHVPLADVPRLVTAELIIETVRITADALRRDFGLVRPRLAVAGLNPHAGESGTIGREEVAVIAPALAALSAEGLDIDGPLSADTLFHAAARARYDAAIAMYHDQALIPIKTLAFDRGVNVTLGLPFVRTSPDHGTAFDIAGTGRADPTSFVEALRLAARMSEQRAGFAAAGAHV